MRRGPIATVGSISVGFKTEVKEDKVVRRCTQLFSPIFYADVGRSFDQDQFAQHVQAFFLERYHPREE